jgi:hypothetical protein
MRGIDLGHGTTDGGDAVLVSLLVIDAPPIGLPMPRSLGRQPQNTPASGVITPWWQVLNERRDAYAASRR